MILLHRLRTRNFKQLTDLTLPFPERGTVLIEGLNEAGKSSLFEAVYFALYGRAMNQGTDYGVRHLKSYHAEEMEVELDFSIDGRPFAVSRRVVANQRASLTCPAAEGGRETFTGIQPVAKRLHEELRLSPEALLNTCFVEQKGLERLESLRADERRETVNELLNLRILSRLEEEYRTTRDDHAAVLTQSRRVEIAGLDAALPGLKVEVGAAARCLAYTRLLECESEVERLQAEIDRAEARQAEIGVRRGEIRSAFAEAERLKTRLTAIDSDLSLRARAWDQALRLLAAADGEVRRLETLAAGLPDREARQAEWEGLAEFLVRLERLEEAAARRREAVREAQGKVADFDRLQAEWDARDHERGEREAALRLAEAEAAGADDALRERGRLNQRSERLTLLLRHVVAGARAEREAADLERRLESARGAAGRLEEHRGRLRELVGLEERLRSREAEARELRGVESEIAAAEREQAALRARGERIALLEAELSRLEADGPAIEAAERAALGELREAEKRAALAEWAAAAERLAECDPGSGLLADLERRQREAKERLEAGTAAARRAARGPRLALGTAGAGLLLGLGGVAVSQAVTLGLLGVLLVVAGLLWATAAGKQAGAARAEEAAARKGCDSLEGERRAVERAAQDAGAERERRAAQEAECRRVLRALAVEIPAGPSEARRAVQALPDTPIAAARQAFEEARERAAEWRGRQEVAQRSLDAELSRPVADAAALREQILRLAAERDRRRECAAQAAEAPVVLASVGVEDAAGLEALVEGARREVAASEAAAVGVPELEHGRAIKARQASDEREEAARLAKELGLPGEAPSVWASSAQAERGSHLQATASVTDDALRARVETTRDEATALREQLTRLVTAQEARRVELDRRPRTSLLEGSEAARTSLTATEAELAPLRSVRPALETAGLPSNSADLRPRLAVLRGELERDREEAGALLEKRVVRNRRAEEAQERDREVGNAWERVIQEEAPETPEGALARLPEARAGALEALAGLDEPGLRREDEALQEETTALGRRQAGWAHERDQHRARSAGFRQELGIDAETDAASLPARFPELAGASERSAAVWEAELERRREAVRSNRAERRARAETLGLGDATLELRQEQEALARTERDLAVKRRAEEIVRRTRQSIVNRVMPLTMQNMRQILPLLTGGRYQDAEWDEANNVLSVYDMSAGSFQRKRVFSGGARDQISLALRLAFALATLPGEHNVRPGWLFLDEPLSSFDHARTQALVDLLTRGLVRRQFAQVFLISHSQSFDPGRFDYRLRLDSGQVVESNLPA